MNAPQILTAAQQPLPMVTIEDLRAVLTSRALAAFTAARAEAALAWGHTPATDAAEPCDLLLLKAMQRMKDAADFFDRHNHRVPPGKRDAAMRKIERAGAMLLALWDRVACEEDSLDPQTD